MDGKPYTSDTNTFIKAGFWSSQKFKRVILQNQEYLLKQQIEFFAEIRHAYHEYNMVEEAIYEVSQKDQLEVLIQKENIYIVSHLSYLNIPRDVL